MPEDNKPDGNAFFGVRHEDLPYNSERKGSRFSGPTSLKDQGAMLLTALTGVVNTNRRAPVRIPKTAKAKSEAPVKPSQYHVSGTDFVSTAKRLDSIGSVVGKLPPEASYYEGRGVRRASQGPTKKSPGRPRVASLAHIPRRISVGQFAQLSDRRRSSGEGSSFRSPRPPRSPRRGPGKDEACDTSDIPINTFFMESDDELLIETVSSLDLERQRVEDPRGHKLALDDYIGKLKETTNRLGIRASMLHELTTEDIESSYSTLPPPPKARKLSAPGSGPVLEFEEEKPTASQHVKQARRLAGSMNIHQQTNGLRDIHSWLQHLGSIAQEDDFLDVGGSRQKGKDTERGEDDGPGDWRLPSSPAMALQLAQEDLRNRLGSLYSERQEVLNRQAELVAATTLATRDGEAEEARLREFLRRMHKLEDEYQILGGKVAENSTEAEKLDKRHQRLRKDIRESDQQAGTIKSSDKGASVVDEDQQAEAHMDAKKKAGRKTTSKVEDPGLEGTGTTAHESKKTAHRRLSQEEKEDNIAAGSRTAADTAAILTAPAARGSLVKATPAPETRRKEELKGYETGTEEDGEEKPESRLSESVGKLLEDSDEERDEAIEEGGPDFGDIEMKKKRKARRKTEQDDRDETGAPEGDEENRRRRSTKRRAEGEGNGTSTDYDNISSLYESQSSQDAKVKYIRDDKKRGGATQRSALDWKILLESGQCKHRSCQTDPLLTERRKKARSSLDGTGRRDSDNVSQMDNKELKREIVRLKQRLRFWRARNWAMQHKTQPLVSSPSGPQYAIDDSVPVMQHSSSETADSRGAEATTPNPYDLGGLQGSSSLRGRDSVSVSRSPLPDQPSVIHEESLIQGGMLPESTPSFVVFGTSPNHSPRDSRLGSLLPARESRVGSLVPASRSRTSSKGSISIRRNSPPGAEALRLQATAVRPNSL